MSALTVFGGVIGVATLMVISSIFNGYALSVLWGWFVVPVFHLPELSIVPAIGIAMVVSYLTYQENNCEKEKEERGSFGEVIMLGTMAAIIKPLFALFFGWIVHLFM